MIWFDLQDMNFSHCPCYWLFHIAHARYAIGSFTLPRQDMLLALWANKLDFLPRPPFGH